MPIIIVDCESDGPIPSLYSLVCFGAVVVEPALNRTFYGQTRPVSEKWIPEALAISGFSRAEHEKFDDPTTVFIAFREWLRTLGGSGSNPIFVSDNVAFDWQWINFYFHAYTGANPFGFSGRRIGDFYAGTQNDWSRASAWKSLRRTHHTHNPVDDAIGNAEALLEITRNTKGFPKNSKA